MIESPSNYIHVLTVWHNQLIWLMATHNQLVPHFSGLLTIGPSVLWPTLHPNMNLYYTPGRNFFSLMHVNVVQLKIHAPCDRYYSINNTNPWHPISYLCPDIPVYFHFLSLWQGLLLMRYKTVISLGRPRSIQIASNLIYIGVL